MARFFLAFLLLLSLSLPALQASMRGAFGIGYRYDHQEYTVSTLLIDPMSKLEWSGVQSVEAVGELEWILGRYHYGIEGALGQIFEGTFKDFDWMASGQTFLFSKTTSDVQGNNYDLTLKTGFDLYFGRYDSITVRPLIGVSYYNMYYKDRDLWQHIESGIGMAPSGEPVRYMFPIEARQVAWGVVTTHRSQWLTGWVGFDFLWAVIDELVVRASARGHGGGYRSNGDWRLRPDLVPGESFENTATAGGIEARLGGAWALLPGTSVVLDFRYRYFKTTNGNHRTNFVSGESVLTPFNGALWSSFEVILGLSRCF